MNNHNATTENNLLFLGIEEAISQLNERILHYGHDRHLLVALSPDAMHIAIQLASASGLDVALSDKSVPSTFPKNVVKFQFNIVKESGRDLPQDFVFHEERNLKAKMISFYEDIYDEIGSQYPNDRIILVDALTNNGAEFRRKEGIIELTKVTEIVEQRPNDGPTSIDRHFIYLHQTNGSRDGINMMLEQKFELI
jgi:hypothetical protein